MEKLVSLVRAGSFKILVVDSLDFGVVVRLSVLEVEIVLVESLGTHSLEVCEVSYMTGLDGLTAAVYTAAGTAHNLDELLGRLACSDLVKKLSGILKT